MNFKTSENPNKNVLKTKKTYLLKKSSNSDDPKHHHWTPVNLYTSPVFRQSRMSRCLSSTSSLSNVILRNIPFYTYIC